MTQYLLAVNQTPDDVAAMDALTPEEMQAMFDATARFNEKLQAEGVWVFAGGLKPHRARRPPSTTPAPRRSSPTARSPSPRSTSAASGSSRLPDLDAALKWAAEGSKACGGRVEVRPFQEEPGA